MTPENQTNTQAQVNRATGIDAGLRDHFRNVYTVMAMGLTVTGLTAFALSNSTAAMQLIFGTPLQWVAMFAPLAFIFFGFNQKTVMTKSAGYLRGMFYAFSAIFGVSLSVIFLAYAGADIARAFFITAATFAAMSILGYTTKIDLSKMGAFLFMGVIGLLIAIVANIFLQSSMLDFIISVAGVLIYTALVAFDTQQIKESYHHSYGESNNKAAVMGALSLYINFIMMFQFILSLISPRE